MSEAPSTMWQQGNLLPEVPLARALSRSRKKLPSEASKVGPSAKGRYRMELSEFLLAGKKEPLRGRKAALSQHPDFRDNERGKEPSKAYRQDLQQCVDATYVNLGTMYDSPEVEWANLRLLSYMGRSLRSSRSRRKIDTGRREAVKSNATSHVN